MTFTKTSQKFGQWADSRANTVYGLGFSTEQHLQQVTSFTKSEGLVFSWNKMIRNQIGLTVNYVKRYNYNECVLKNVIPDCSWIAISN